MATTSNNSNKDLVPSLSSIPYAALHPQDVVLLLPYRPYTTALSRIHRCIISAAAVTAVFGLLTFFLYPSNPTIQFVRGRLNHIRINSSHNIALDLSFDVTIKVHNNDFCSLRYRSLMISVGYRGKNLGFLTSEGERIRAKGSSYVNATLDLDGIEIAHDVFYLIEDFATGEVPIDLNSVVTGKLGFGFFSFPVKARLYCNTLMSTKNQTIIPQDCYPVG